MSSKYKISDLGQIYFVTFTVVNWLPALSRPAYKELFLESIRYCQTNKGLQVYAWVVMDNHVHLVIGTKGEEKLEDIVRDMKKYTSVHICRAIEGSVEESRRTWMLRMFKLEGQKSGKHQKYKFWEENYHPIELQTPKMIKQKIDYIHMNPVKAGIVFEEEQYVYSSATDYAGKKGKLEILLAW